MYDPQERISIKNFKTLAEMLYGPMPESFSKRTFFAANPGSMVNIWRDFDPTVSYKNYGLDEYGNPGFSGLDLKDMLLTYARDALDWKPYSSPYNALRATGHFIAISKRRWLVTSNLIWMIAERNKEDVDFDER